MSANLAELKEDVLGKLKKIVDALSDADELEKQGHIIDAWKKVKEYAVIDEVDYLQEEPIGDVFELLADPQGYSQPNDCGGNISKTKTLFVEDNDCTIKAGPSYVKTWKRWKIYMIIKDVEDNELARANTPPRFATEQEALNAAPEFVGKKYKQYMNEGTKR